MAGKNSNTLNPSDKVLTRRKAKELQDSKTVKPAVKNLASRTPVSTLFDQRLKNLETQVSVAFEKISSLATDVDLMKQQIIDQSRDVNSIILDGSMQTASSVHIQPLIDEISSRIAVIEQALASTQLGLEKLEVERNKSMHIINVTTDEITRASSDNNSFTVSNLVNAVDSNSDEVLNVIGPSITQTETQLTREQNCSQPSSQPTLSQINGKPKWKWFHVSAITTLTTEMVRSYIAKNLGCNNVRCFSLTPRNSRTLKLAYH